MEPRREYRVSMRKTKNWHTLHGERGIGREDSETNGLMRNVWRPLNARILPDKSLLAAEQWDVRRNTERQDEGQKN